jgi:exodeoxyribonuclease V alpha subunit
MSAASEQPGGEQPGEPRTLDGTLERVVFSGADSGFVVARLSTIVGGAAAETVTVVGEMVGVSEGTPLRLHGAWVHDRKWGRQFKIESYQLRAPETLIGIERFLSSASSPASARDLAKRMVRTFGMETLEVIDRAPAAAPRSAASAPGAPSKIAGAWRRAPPRAGRDGVPARPRRVGGVRGPHRQALRQGRHQPGAREPVPPGASRSGASASAPPTTSPRSWAWRATRRRAWRPGSCMCSASGSSDGHVHVPEDAWLLATAELLGVDAGLLPPAVTALEGRRVIVREVLGERGRCASLAAAYQAEVAPAERLAELVRTPAAALALDVDAALHAFETGAGLSLAPQQRQAVRAAALDKCVVITGGPGVGKTTIVRAIVHLARLAKRRIALAAPTGRAALRLAESTGTEAATLHRLLEFQPQSGQFARAPTTCSTPTW